MSPVAWYLGVGIALLAGMVLVGRWQSRADAARPGPVDLAVPHGARARPWARVLDRFVGPLLAGAVVVALWPLAVALALWVAHAQRRRSGTDAAHEPSPGFGLQERKFAVSPGDLREQLAVEEIERRERVSDPLGAVPDLPFGHLHPAWLAFLEQRGTEDALWSFSTHWTPTWGREELRAGYVIVREDAIGPHFLTVWRSLGVS